MVTRAVRLLKHHLACLRSNGKRGATEAKQQPCYVRENGNRTAYNMLSRPCRWPEFFVAGYLQQFSLICLFKQQMYVVLLTCTQVVPRHPPQPSSGQHQVQLDVELSWMRQMIRRIKMKKLVTAQG